MFVQKRIKLRVTWRLHLVLTALDTIMAIDRGCAFPKRMLVGAAKRPSEGGADRDDF